MKKHPISFGGLNKDISPNNYPKDKYFDLVNGRVVMNDSQTAFSISNEKGTTLIKSVPDIQNSENIFTVVRGATTIETIAYTNTELQSIPNLTQLRLFHFAEIRDRFFVFTIQSTYLQLWEIINNEFKLLYNNNLNVSINNPIRKCIGRYENNDVQKLYFTDFNNYLRFINVEQEDLINLPKNKLNFFTESTLDNPTLVETLPGGNFKAGYVQYAYNVYDKNGAESKISPFSKMFVVANNYFGGEQDETIGTTFNVKIDNLPEDTNIINVYRLYYQSNLANPEVSLIIESEVTSTEFTFQDDNNFQESSSTIENVLFLGSDPFICKDIEVKDNYMFPVNIKYDAFSVDYDTRAYSFDNTGQALIQDSQQGNITLNDPTDNVPETHNCINPSIKEDNQAEANYKKYIYQSNGTTLGAEGPNVSIKITTKDVTPYNHPEGLLFSKNSASAAGNGFDNKSLKRDETYRFFIRFKNSTGQYTFPKWICDLRMPNQDTHPVASETTGDISTRIYTISLLGVEVTLNSLPSNVESWEILREKRDLSDRTILTQGIVTNYIVAPSETNGNYANEGKYIPNWDIRAYHTLTPTPTIQQSYVHSMDLLNNNEMIDYGPNSNPSVYRMATEMLAFYSPEVLKNKSQFPITDDDYLTSVGGVSTRIYTNNLTLLPKRFHKGTSSGDVPLRLDTNLGSSNIQSGIQATRNGLSHYYQGVEKRTPVVVETSAINLNDIYHFQANVERAFSTRCIGVQNVPIIGKPLYIPKGEGSTKTYNYVTDFDNSRIVDDVTIEVFDVNGNKAKLRNRVNESLAIKIGFFEDNTSNRLEEVLENTIGTSNINFTFPVMDYKRVISNQYGGNTYAARKLNSPVVVSSTTSNLTNESFEGDVFINYWNFQRSETTQALVDRNTNKEVISILLECNINMDARYDEVNNSLESVVNNNNLMADYKLPLDVYNRQKDFPFAVAEGINFQEINHFDNRVLASNSKINGEVKDAWLQYRDNNYLDVNGSYGAITGIYEDRDQLFVFQPEAISQLVINPSVQTQASNLEIQLGKGTLLYDNKYLTTSSGSVNQFGVFKTPYGLHYYDLLNNKIANLTPGENPLSDIKGINTWLQKTLRLNDLNFDNPLINKGVTGYYDHELKELNISFLQFDPTPIPVPGEENQFITLPENYTINYSFMLNEFHRFYNFATPLYINNQNKIYWGTENEIHQHKVGDRGFYLGEYKNTKMTFVVAPEYVNNIFDTLTFNSKVSNNSDLSLETITKVQVYNDYQDSSLVNADLKRRFREWRLNLPREENTRNRIMGQYCYVTLEFENNGNKEFSIQNIIVNYRNFPASFI